MIKQVKPIIVRRLGLLGLTRRDCEWVHSRIKAYASCDPSLSESAQEFITKHMLVCERCRVELAAADTFIDEQSESSSAAELLPMDAGKMARRILWMQKKRVEVQVPSTLRVRRIGLIAAAVLLVMSFAIYPVLADILGLGRQASNQVAPQPLRLGALQNETPSITSGIEQTLLAKLDDDAIKSSARVKVEASLPHSEEDYEAWARKAFPHILWLYDVLRAPENEFHWNGHWRDLLVFSGECLEFDAPKTMEEPMCLPRLSSLQKAAMAAGFSLSTTTVGGRPLPKMAWRDLSNTGVAESDVHVRIEPLPQASGTYQRTTYPALVSNEYCQVLAKDRVLSEAVFTYFLIASNVVMDELTDININPADGNIDELHNKAFSLLCKFAESVSATDNREEKEFVSRISDFFALRHLVTIP